MNLITITAYVTAGLTVIALALIVAIVALNIVSGQRLAREDRLRTKMMPALKDYLAGCLNIEAVMHELQRDREVALECLVETASGLSLERRLLLHPFFDHFQFTQKLMDDVRSKNWSKCIRAATQLGFTGNPECIPLLIQALADEMLDVRIAAARALAQLGACEAVEPILGALALPGTLPQQNTTEILYEMGPVAIEPLRAFIQNEKNHREEGWELAVAVRVLGLLKEKCAEPDILSLTKHPNAEVRLNSARAIGLIGSQSSIEPLIHLLRDPVWEVRSSAVKALGQLQDTTAIPVISKALGDPEWWVRFNAAEALYELGDPGVDALKHTMVVNPDAFARDISKQIVEEHGLRVA